MRRRVVRCTGLACAVMALWFVAFTEVAVGSLRPPAPGQAATAGRWVPPRTADGHPDLQGFWEYGGSYFIEGHPADAWTPRATKSLIVDPPDGKIPYQAWAVGKNRQNEETFIDPYANCQSGVPRQVFSPRGHQIIQTPGRVVILSEWAHVYRVIPTDARPHLPDKIRLFMGDSRGHWEGDTLVVDVTNLTDKTWFDHAGNFHSDALHVVEGVTLVDANTIQYEVTLDDPKVYTRPWKIAFPLRRMEQGHEVWEEPCHEANEDLIHMRNLGLKTYVGISGIPR